MSLSCAKKTYNPTFAVMKGIAIVSVVVGHCTMSKNVEAYVNQYHLAAFFFVAGYFLTDKYVASPWLLVKKRVKSLYLPFVLSCLACVLLHNFLTYIHVYNTSLSVQEMLSGGADVLLKLTSSEPMMGAMWFCPTLLFASFISIYVLWAGSKFKNKSIKITILFMICTIGIGEVALKVLHLKSPYSIWQNMIISGILFEGWLYHKYVEKYMPTSKRLLILIGVGIACALAFSLKQGWLFNLQAVHVKEVPAFNLLMATYFASIMVYAFSSAISNSRAGKLIAIVGNHSFSIMLLHFLAFKVVSWGICVIEKYPLTRISDFPTVQYEKLYCFFAYVVVGCALPIGIVRIKNLLLSKL